MSRSHHSSHRRHDAPRRLRPNIGPHRTPPGDDLPPPQQPIDDKPQTSLRQISQWLELDDQQEEDAQ